MSFVADTHKNDPLWYQAMMEFSWTVKSIRAAFDVPRAIAIHIQHSFPDFESAGQIVDAHNQLCSQLGH